MTPKFIQETQKLNKITNQPIFIAFDGQGDITEYIKLHAIFSNNLNVTKYFQNNNNNNKTNNNLNIDLKFIDLYLAINSNFFILNPRSTFSFQVYVIREIFHLKSVPIPNKNQDMFYKSEKEYIRDDMIEQKWVSYQNIEQIAKEIH